MNSWNTFLSISSLFAVGSAFLFDPSIFEDHPKLCSSLNITLFQNIERIIKIIDGENVTESGELDLQDIEIPSTTETSQVESPSESRSSRPTFQELLC